MYHYVDKTDLRRAEILLSIPMSKPGLKVCYHEVQLSSYSYLKYLPIKEILPLCRQLQWIILLTGLEFLAFSC